MLSSIRKFSNSILAKIILFFVAIPFIFWGMGDIFSSGNQNTIVKIDKEKVNTQEFINYLNTNTKSVEKIDNKLIDQMLSKFIGHKLILKEIDDLNIMLSDRSLKQILTNQRFFKEDDKFSRTEYEKFLISNSFSSVSFEENLSKQEKENQLFNFVGGGVMPSLFLVNSDYNKLNQKRFVSLINLNSAYEKDNIVQEGEIKKYYDKNKEDYKNIFKSIKFNKLNPKILTNDENFNNLFFEKIDEIDELIVNGKDLEYIRKNYNLSQSQFLSFNQRGKDKDDIEIKEFPIILVQNIFNIKEDEPVILIENKDNFFLIELVKTESIYKKIGNTSVKKDIILNLQKKGKQKFISGIIAKINKNNFNKIDFDKFSNEKNIKIKKIIIKNQNDDKNLKKEIIKQIYAFPEKKVFIVADLNFSESFLVFIEKIENKSISKDSDNYNKYFNLTKARITNNLYNTYDSYLKNKYKIDINYNVVDSVKNNLK